MTQRLYYSDSYTRNFTAQVVERATFNNRPAVVLDQTYFYPASGGQPHDLGTLNQANVLEVVVRESDQAVLHVLDHEIDAGEAAATLHWPRRFDHMQQHTGQHLLSQACWRAARAETVGFHLGERLTIDLSPEKISPEALHQAEELANQIVVENLRVRAWFPTVEELPRLSLRKTPEVDGRLRVVAIGDFDMTACGGTHVAQTGEVGLIKIVKVERAKKSTRLEFLCGGRARADFQRKHLALTQLAADFSCAVGEVTLGVTKLRAENQSLQKELKAAEERLLDYELKELLTALPDTWGVRVVRQVWANREVAPLRKLAMRLTAEPKVLVLLGTAGAQAHLLFARSNDLDHDMKGLLLGALKELGSARGGGDARLAQGGGLPASVEQLEHVLKEVEKKLA